MTETDKARAALAQRIAPNPLMWCDHIPGRLDFEQTKTDGVHVALVSPDREVTFKGALWIDCKGVK